MKYRVFLCETCEPAFIDEWHEDFDTLEEAKRRIISVNVGNHFAGSKDWYIQAKEKIEEVK